MSKKASDYKNESRESFNKQAEKFDSSYYGAHGKKMHKIIGDKLEHFQFNTLLDVGCGTGNFLLLISSKFDVQIAGVDLSPDMLAIAKDKLDKTADLRIGDSEKLPFEDENFDIVTCTDSFHHYPHPENVLKEFKRVLKPKGKVIIANPWAPTPLRQLGNLITPLSRGGDVRVYSEDEFRKLFKNTGFSEFKWEQIGFTSSIVVASK